MNEFELIHTYFMHSSANGDDAAILDIPENHSLVTSIDTLVAGRHFRESAEPYDIGYKTLAVNLSDLAAMGAKPNAFLLSLTLPELNEAWIKGFCEGLYALAHQFQVEHVGGDITKGPLTISVVAFGEVPQHSALTRSGACVGDDIYVSGVLGDAAIALHNSAYDQTRLNRPLPRIALGLALRDLATSCIDISDGLAQDLQHILTASAKGADIHSENIPHSGNLEHALSGGDDYELCFTVPPNTREIIAKLSQQLSLPLTRIGTVQSDPRLRILTKDNHMLDYKQNGYQHF